MKKKSIQITGEQNCPNTANHTPTPDGYLEWHDWAARAAKVATQSQCSGCGLFAIWTPNSGKELPEFGQSPCLNARYNMKIPKKPVKSS